MILTVKPPLTCRSLALAHAADASEGDTIVVTDVRKLERIEAVAGAHPIS